MFDSVPTNRSFRRSSVLFAICSTLLVSALLGCEDPTLLLDSSPNASHLVLNVTRASIAEGDSLRLRVYVKDTAGGAPVEIDPANVKWSTDDPGVAIVTDGVVAARQNGETRITARTSAGAQAGADVRVHPNPSVLVLEGEVTAESEVAKPLAEPVRMRLVDRNGSPVSGAHVSFRVAEESGSVSPAVAMSDDSGLVSVEWTLGTRAGEQTLTAEYSGRPKVDLDVHVVGVPGPASALAVDPPSASVRAGETVQLDAVATDAYGNAIAGFPVSWSVSDTSVASVDAEGKATGKRTGTASVTAIEAGEGAQAQPGMGGAGGLKAEAALVVSSGTPSSVSVFSGDGQTGVAGNTLGDPLVVAVRDAHGNGVPGVPVTWKVASGGGGVAPLDDGTDASGQARAAWKLGDTGPQNVTAQIEGQPEVSFTAQIGRVETVIVTPASAILLPGDSLALAAELRDESGNVIVGPQVTWFTSDTLVATVDMNGMVRAHESGGANITAWAGGKHGTASIFVEKSGTGSGAPGGEGSSGSGSTGETEGSGSTGGGSTEPPSTVNGLLPAFPGAEGWGATALNECRSRPLQVLFVTNTNSDGSGSLDQAVRDARSDRFTFIIFRTGGRIRAPVDGIRFNASCVYFAGQTAPGDGIVIDGTNTSFIFRGSGGNIGDIVMRYLRFRGRHEHTKNNLIIAKGERIVLDHLSLSWTDNYLLSIARYNHNWSHPISNLSVQNSIISEVFAVHPTAFVLGSNQAMWPLETIGMTNISVHKNLFAHNSHRNPMTDADNILIANNVIYNWRQGTSHVGIRGVADFVNNFAKQGPQTRSAYRYAVNILCGDDHSGEISVYATGNIGPMSDDPNGDNWTDPTRQVACYYRSGDYDGQAVPAQWRRTIPQPWTGISFPVRIDPAKTAFNSVLASVGADARLACDGRWEPAQDRVDARVVADTRNGTGPSLPPTDETSVGGYPSYARGTPCQDTDGDGLPDAWEQRYFGCATCAKPEAVGRNGYLLIEHYVNGTDPR